MTATGAGRAAQTVVDVGDDTFEQVVIEGSRARPVVVDFWADWCGPCRQLGPVLERVANEHAGEFLLVKVDVDRAPNAAGRFNVRSIPFVVGFRDGRAASSFVGAQPESAVRRFVAGLLPTEADLLAAEAAEFAAAGHDNAAEDRFTRATELDRRHARAWLGLARLRAKRGDEAGAVDAIEMIGPDAPEEHAEGQRLAAELRLAAGAPSHGSAGELATLEAEVRAHPDDLDRRIAFGSALASAGRHADALEQLLACVQRDPAHRDGAARQHMLDVFELLGPEHELVATFRRRLAAALFK